MSDPTRSVLVVDDDDAVSKVVAGLLEQAGFETQVASSGERALTLLDQYPFDVVLSDLRMPSMDGFELLAAIKQRWPSIPVVMLTAHGTVPIAVDAMRRGASDFVLKPFDRDELLFVVRKAVRTGASDDTGPEESPSSSSFVGDSPAMREVHDLIRRAGPGDATILLRGESGTGKELVARTIHATSGRREGPFVKVHCAALPDNLLESELFGYEKGAFTGAASRKPGRVELAARGTLFLDEIGDISPAVQVKLLRLLQDREFERLGGTTTEQADVRFIAATHQDLEAMMTRGAFREDLFYRLNVVPIFLPPLRVRVGDIQRLVPHFVRSFGEKYRSGQASIEADAVALLSAEPWPGNVRQLQNFIERLIVLSDGASLTASDVNRELARKPVSFAEPKTAARSSDGSLTQQRLATERDALVDALRAAGDNRTVAARILGISRRTLYNKLAEHDLA